MTLIEALSGNTGSWFTVCNLILTQLDELWKIALIFLKMGNDLNFVLLVCNIGSTKLDEIWRTTPIFGN
jgi:hypothetical protein